MKKTCANCEHFCTTLQDPASEFHIHYYCAVWRTIVPHTFLINEYDDNGCYWDDIECGMAYCHLFSPGEEVLSEGLIKARQDANESEHMAMHQP